MAKAGARVKKVAFFMTANKAIQMNYICYHVRFTICVFVQVFFFAFLLFPETGKDIHHRICCLEECIHFWKFRSDVD